MALALNLDKDPEAELAGRTAGESVTGVEADLGLDLDPPAPTLADKVFGEEDTRSGVIGTKVVP